MNHSGEISYCEENHYVEARTILALHGFPANDANEQLLMKGWIRCTISEDNLFYERRKLLTQKQRKELTDIAIEERLTLTNDDGKILNYAW